MDQRTMFVDLGKVLLDFDHRKTGRGLSVYSPLSPGELFTRIYETDLETRFNRGEFETPQAFFETARQQLKLACDYEQFVDAWNTVLERPIDGNIALIQKLRDAGYGLILVSDTNPLNLEAAMQHETLRHLFPPKRRVLSYEIKMLKREGTGMFLHALRKFGLTASDCTLIDDNAECVRNSERVGMHGIQYHATGHPTFDTKQVEKELKAAGFRW